MLFYRLVPALLAVSLSVTATPTPSMWSGLSNQQLLAISEKGESGFQHAMLYILGLADGIESQMVINWQQGCRNTHDDTFKTITKKVLARMKALDAGDKPAGHVAVHAYLHEFCPKVTLEAKSVVLDGGR